MSGKVLLFGFDSLLQALTLGAALAPLGVETLPVARSDYNKALSDLAGLTADDGPALPYMGGPLGGRMVVFCGVEEKQLDQLLQTLSKGGAGPDCLKAVLTPHNRGWNALKLYQELLREHQALGGK